MKDKNQRSSLDEKIRSRKTIKLKCPVAFIVAFFLKFTPNLGAQSLGGHSGDIDWQEVDTKNVRVIFPTGLEKRAFRIANIINHIKRNNTYSVGNKSKKLDLILQTHQVVSNGFVTLAPYRSEFFGTGPQNNSFLGSIDWLDVLSLHEYRHALQYANGRRGLTNILYFFMGETGWSLGINLCLPPWYLEGDAVETETVLSKAGRGRTPSFLRGLRANLLNNRNYSYMTSENGSYKNLIPNHYPLGYTMVNYVRNKYGPEVWRKILADAGSDKTIIYPFAFAVRKHTGKFPYKIYQEAYGQLKAKWERELKRIKLTPTEKITKKDQGVVTFYNYPCLLNDGSIVAIKKSYDQIQRIVHIKGGKEKELCNYGQAPLNFLSENNGKIAWTELQQDPRRANVNYTRVVVYDLKTGEKKYLISKSKYFSPQYSERGDRVVVVRADEYLQNRLVILNAQNGKEIQELPNPDNDFLSFPKWANNDSAIIFVAKKNSRLAIMKYDLQTLRKTQLTKWTAHTIEHINVRNNTVYFSASYSGIDNIYAVKTNGDKRIKQMTSVRVGAYQPAISQDEKKLVMVEYTDMGSSISQIDISRGNNSKKNFKYSEPVDMGQYSITRNEHEHNILDEIEDKTYKVTPYSGLFKGMRLHSWGLAIGDVDNSTGIQLSFANILTDFMANFQVMYNKNEKKMNYSGDILYGKWFVETGIHGKIQERSITYRTAPGTLSSVTFKDNSYGLSLGIPLNWNRGSFLFGFKPFAEYTYHMPHDYEGSPSQKSNINFGSINSGFTFSAVQMKARQNINPRYGIVLNPIYKRSLKGDVKAERLNANGTIFLPGIMMNHSLKINANWKKELKTNDFQFVDNFVYSRGYDQSSNDEVCKIALNYGFPILYPDWGFAGFTYFQRIKVNLFYDASRLKNEDTHSYQNSYGLEIFFDNTMLNMLPVSLGFRESFPLNEDALNPKKKHKFEFLFQMRL